MTRTVTCTEWESKMALGIDVSRPREALTRSVAEALEHHARVGGAAVAKACGVPHKSEHGFVRVGLDAAGLRQCWFELAAAGDGTVLVSEHLLGELELLVGGVRDAEFGPIISIGLGGVTAEVDPDVVVLLAPPEPGEVERALARLRAAELLAGFRGTPPVALAALDRIVGAVADLLARDESVVEVECNPVIVVAGMPYVADALVVREERP